MKTITFYSYKGGTGRSLALANAARYLARLESKVVVIDLDLEAPGLHYKFSLDERGTPLSVGSGVVDYLHKLLVEQHQPSSLSDFVTPIEIPGAGKRQIQLIAAGRAPSDEYWQKLGQINWHDLFYSSTGNGVQIFLDLKHRIEEDLAPDFLLVDSRTGITEMAGVATTLFADKIVCLVVPTSENVDGARAVLRSLQRTRREVGHNPLDITVALSRLPMTQDQDWDRTASERIRRALNEQAEDLRDTLACPEVFILHSESALQIKESLRVGGSVSADDSILLRDYLRLFANLVPKESVAPRVDQLIQKLKDKMWDDADAAVKEVEELAQSFGHPETYRALLRFYNVRNVSGSVVLKRAQRLWEITRESKESVLWDAVRKNFTVTAKFTRSRGEWKPDPEFIDSVWRGAGNRDEEFALRLAHYYSIEDDDSRAANILQETMTSSGPTLALVTRCIAYLSYAKRSSEADSLIDQLAPKLSEEPEFALEWARHAIRTKNSRTALKLASIGPFSLVREREPFLAIRLLSAADMKKDANELADQMIGDLPEIEEETLLSKAADAFASLGRWDEFESNVKQRIPPSALRELRRRLGISKPVSTRSESWTNR